MLGFVMLTFRSSTATSNPLAMLPVVSRRNRNEKEFNLMQGHAVYSEWFDARGLEDLLR
jgi:hypothetical protein